jgi:CheY-like chemotaxis protein
MGTFERRAGWDGGRSQAALTTSPQHFYAGAAAGATALIVEDDYRNVFALTALLERGRMAVVTAESGAVALNILQNRIDIGIVLMDIMMPVMDGYETMTAIRKRPRSLEIPIIAITGKGGRGERERCIAAGASDYLPKPIDTPALLTAVTRWLLGVTEHLPES